MKHEGDINLFFLEFLSSQTHNNNRRMTIVINSKRNRMKEILLKNNAIIINNELMSGHSIGTTVVIQPSTTCHSVGLSLAKLVSTLGFFW